MLFPPDQIRAALARGPLTFRMIAAAFGYAVVSSPADGWWRRLWLRGGYANAGSLEKMLADMVAVGQIVRMEGPPVAWALPPKGDA